MTETLHVIKRVFFALGQLVEGCPDKSFLQCLYDMDYAEYAAYDKVDEESDEDGLEGLRHLTFKETEGVRDIWECPSREGAHLVPMKLRKQNVGMEVNPKWCL